MILENMTGLWWSALSCSAAAILVLWGAGFGPLSHRLPRAILGVAVTVIALSYWVDLGLGLPNLRGAEMRRGAGWMLWPALAWTAYTGIVLALKARTVRASLTRDGDG